VVANLVRLRFLVLKNSLLRSTWQLVAVIIGAIYGIAILVGVLLGMLALNAAPVELARTIVVIGGSALIVGWVVLPLVFSGIDQTLDPHHLVTFPIPLNTLLVGLATCGVLGVPGAITTLASLGTALSWLRMPGVALVAFVCGAIGALTCVVASRMVTALSTGFSSNRRFREISGIVAFIPLILLGPIVISVTSGVRGASNALPDFAEALSWTPIGAIWAVPSSVALGDYGGAAVRLLIGVAVLVVLAALWRWSLARALVTPTHTSSRARARGKLGLFARFPGTPAGAVAARCLTYWTRDPRYTRQLLTIPLIPALMIFYSTLNHSLGFLLAIGPLIAFLLSVSLFSDLSYDSTAFALHISTGLRGSADRAGRVAALASFAIPVVIILTIASTWISSSWAALPALLGLSIGILLSGLGLSSVTSARFAFPVPEPGASPFAARPGTSFTNSLTTLAIWGILAALVLPEIVLFVVAAITGQALFGWTTLVVGILLGTALLFTGIRRGGLILDHRSVDMLALLKRDR
jgi:ABC-2 type transport system permease protein